MTEDNHTEIAVEEKNLFSNQRWAIFAGPVLFVLLSFQASPSPTHPHLMVMAGITAWIALWWLTECVHLSVTSLLPFLLIPATGIADIKVVSAQYMDPILFLFIGGFFLAFAIERWGLHRRLALGILSHTGRSASSVLAGIMVTSWMISMWISNTATVMMLFSAILAVIGHLEHHFDNQSEHRSLSAAFLIGLAYSASIGGMATLVGTPTNMIFYRIYDERYGAVHPVHFADWMLIAFPVSLILLVCCWFIIKLVILNKSAGRAFDPLSFKNQLSNLGKWNKDEITVAVLFGISAILWFTRAEIEIGSFHFNGWAALFPHPEQMQDGTVAIAIALLLFLIPSRTAPGRNLLTWKEASRLPYEIILLFGSGFALSKGFETSGLSDWLAAQLLGLKHVPVVLLVLGVCFVVTLISEFASNVASIQLVMPVLISIQAALDIDPRLLLIPAALAASSGFMLPVATAPNTIVFSSGHIRVREMASVGFLTDLFAIAIITIASLLFF